MTFVAMFSAGIALAFLAGCVIVAVTGLWLTYRDGRDV